MEKAPPGRNFLLAGEAWTVRRLATRVAERADTKPPRRSLSSKSARRLFRVAGPLLRLAGRRLPVPLEQLASLERHWNFDDSRARTELGWMPRGLEEGLATTVAYIRSQESAPGAG